MLVGLVEDAHVLAAKAPSYTIRTNITALIDNLKGTAKPCVLSRAHAALYLWDHAAGGKKELAGVANDLKMLIESANAPIATHGSARTGAPTMADELSWKAMIELSLTSGPCSVALTILKTASRDGTSSTGPAAAFSNKSATVTRMSSDDTFVRWQPST